jgi:hypothetical protein
MLGQRLLQHLAVLLVVFQGPDLVHAAESLESAQVRLVDVGEVGVRYDDIWQRLDIAETVRQPSKSQWGVSL